MRAVDLVVMHGWQGQSEPEKWVSLARRAIACDLVDKARECGAFASIIVSTNDLGLAEWASGLPAVIVDRDPPGQPFHFGRRFQGLVERYRLERVVYMGGGSSPLISVSTLCELAEQVLEADRLFVANNFYSVDFCAFTPADALLQVAAPVNDNSLGWLLGGDVGLPARELERTTATMFDVDTAVDLAILNMHPGVPARTRRVLDGLELDTGRLEAAMAVFVDQNAEALIAGRISARTMAYVERESACRLRVFSEERGMRADGRLARGEVRSCLGLLMTTLGTESFFQTVIPQLGQAAFIDDRVLWAHCGLWPCAGDRFYSDLLQPDMIGDLVVRQFTEAARSCPVPVVLGGHSMVSGGLQVLVDAAWARGGIDVERPVHYT
jgi:hypothetical protein